VFCPHCGKEVVDDAVVCVGCGRSLQGTTAKTAQGAAGPKLMHRSPAAPLLLPFVTFGIYALYWLVRTKTEMNAQGAKIPTAWLLIIPIADLYWFWRFSAGVELVTKERMSVIASFLLCLFLGLIGYAVVQNELNKATGS